MSKNNRNPDYLNFEEDLNTYIKEDEIKDARVFRDLVKEEVIKEKKLVSRVATPRTEDEHEEPLRREAPKIVGTLFDRVAFLKERIAEANRMMELRKDMHSKMEQEIEADVKEGRAETVRFWKDMLELKSELQELLEQYKTEAKIVDIFKGIDIVDIPILK